MPKAKDAVIPVPESVARELQEAVAAIPDGASMFFFKVQQRTATTNGGALWPFKGNVQIKELGETKIDEYVQKMWGDGVYKIQLVDQSGKAVPGRWQLPLQFTVGDPSMVDPISNQKKSDPADPDQMLNDEMRTIATELKLKRLKKLAGEGDYEQESRRRRGRDRDDDDDDRISIKDLLMYMSQQQQQSMQQMMMMMRERDHRPQENSDPLKSIGPFLAELVKSRQGAGSEILQIIPAIMQMQPKATDLMGMMAPIMQSTSSFQMSAMTKVIEGMTSAERTIRERMLELVREGGAEKEEITKWERALGSINSSMPALKDFMVGTEESPGILSTFMNRKNPRQDRPEVRRMPPLPPEGFLPDGQALLPMTRTQGFPSTQSYSPGGTRLVPRPSVRAGAPAGIPMSSQTPLSSQVPIPNGQEPLPNPPSSSPENPMPQVNPVAEIIKQRMSVLVVGIIQEMQIQSDPVATYGQSHKIVLSIPRPLRKAIVEAPDAMTVLNIISTHVPPEMIQEITTLAMSSPECAKWLEEFFAEFKLAWEEEQNPQPNNPDDDEDDDDDQDDGAEAPQENVA